jgi:hypothetical protein
VTTLSFMVPVSVCVPPVSRSVPAPEIVHAVSVNVPPVVSRILLMPMEIFAPSPPPDARTRSPPVTFSAPALTSAAWLNVSVNVPDLLNVPLLTSVLGVVFPKKKSSRSRAAFSVPLFVNVIPGPGIPPGCCGPS